MINIEILNLLKLKISIKKIIFYFKNFLETFVQFQKFFVQYAHK